MKRRSKKSINPIPDNEPLPDWLSTEDLVDPQELEELAGELDDDDLSANVEKGIRDLPVWKDLVARVGLKEARQILRRGVLINRLTDGNPQN